MDEKVVTKFLRDHKLKETQENRQVATEFLSKLKVCDGLYQAFVASVIGAIPQKPHLIWWPGNNLSPKAGDLFSGLLFHIYFFIASILYFKTPPGAFTSTVSPFFAPNRAFPRGDSFEILFSAISTSVEPTIV